MPAEKPYNSYLSDMRAEQVLELYRKDPKILADVDLFFVQAGTEGPSVKISIPKIYISRFKFFGQDVSEIGAGFADEKITFEVGLSPDYFGPGQLEDFVKKFADYYFYDNMYTGGAYVDCLPLLYWTSAIKFIDQYVFEKSPRMEQCMRLFIHETSRYANLVKLFRHLMNGKLARNDLSAEIAKIFNKDANGLLKFYACREVDNERMYYDFETYECISHPGTPRANDRMFETFHTYVITFGDNPTHNIYTHDVKTYPNVHLLLQKIKNEAPRLFGMPDEQSSRELTCLIERIWEWNYKRECDIGYICIRNGLLSALEWAEIDSMFSSI